MGVLYAKMCIAGTKNFNDIKPMYQKATLEELTKRGYVVNEDGTVTKVAAGVNDFEGDLEDE